MEILFDRVSYKVVGLNRPALPFEFAEEFFGTPNVVKTVQVSLGLKQKKNEQGELLYLHGDEEVTYPTFTIPAVFEKTPQEMDVDGDGTNETVIFNKEISPEQVIELPPVMIDDTETRVFTFKDNPFEFTYDEIKDAPLEYSKEQLADLEREQLLLVVADLYEMNLALQATNQQLVDENANTLLAVAELYELMLGGNN